MNGTGIRAITGVFLLSISIFAGCGSRVHTAQSVQTSENSTEPKKRVLFVDSYHQEYEWGRKIRKGVFRGLRVETEAAGEFNDKKSPVDLEIFYLDTKRNRGDRWAKQAAAAAFAFIMEWKPDVIIASDDNAVKYLAVPYLRKTDIPVVFCGVNWDSSVYGLPSGNITGVLQIYPVEKLHGILFRYGKGQRTGLIASATETEEKNAPYFRREVPAISAMKHVQTFEEFKREYTELQNQVDIIILSEIVTVQGFDHKEMMDFIMDNARIPTGTFYDFMAPYALVTCAISGEEQGELAAVTVLSILGGSRPSDIRVMQNKRTHLYLNMKLAKKLELIFPMEFLDQATFLDEIHTETANPEAVNS